jgi:predicted RNase H-like HicB family nuclease
VRVPSLPEIVTYGKDEREALAMAEDAIRLVLEDCAARGEPIPVGEPPRIREVTITLAAYRPATGDQGQAGRPCS